MVRANTMQKELQLIFPGAIAFGLTAFASDVKRQLCLWRADFALPVRKVKCVLGEWNLYVHSPISKVITRDLLCCCSIVFRARRLTSHKGFCEGSGRMNLYGDSPRTIIKSALLENARSEYNAGAGGCLPFFTLPRRRG